MAEQKTISIKGMIRRDAKIMANARVLIKASKRTSNCQLYMGLYGLGQGGARERCIELGLCPDSNITDYDTMISHIEGQLEN